MTGGESRGGRRPSRLYTFLVGPVIVISAGLWIIAGVGHEPPLPQLFDGSVNENSSSSLAIDSEQNPVRTEFTAPIARTELAVPIVDRPATAPEDDTTDRTPSHHIPETILYGDWLTVPMLIECGELNDNHMAIEGDLRVVVQMMVDNYIENLRPLFLQSMEQYAAALRQRVAVDTAWRSVRQNFPVRLSDEQRAPFEQSGLTVLDPGEAEATMGNREVLEEALRLEQEGKGSKIFFTAVVSPTDTLSDGAVREADVRWYDKESGKEYYAQRQEFPEVLAAEGAITYQLERMAYDVVDLFEAAGACRQATASLLRQRISVIAQDRYSGVGRLLKTVSKRR